MTAPHGRVAAGWTTKLIGRHGTFLVLAVAKGDPGPLPADCPGHESLEGLRDPGPALTVRPLGRPSAPEFDVSLGEAEFTTLKSPGGEYPWGYMTMRGQFTMPAPEPERTAA